MTNKLKCRICLVMDDQGNWAASGWARDEKRDQGPFECLADNLRTTIRECYVDVWIEPPSIAVVTEATVIPVQP